MSAAVFVVACNPQEDSKLPYLLRLPIDGALVLKARDTWPRAARIYCHRFEDVWPFDAEVLEEVPARSCRRRGAVIDLVLDRPRLARSQFVFTEIRGRPANLLADAEGGEGRQPGREDPPRPGDPGGLRDHDRHT